MAPVSGIPSYIPKHVPQVLTNQESVDKGIYSLIDSTKLPCNYKCMLASGFDVELLGDCDLVVGELCRMLGKG